MHQNDIAGNGQQEYISVVGCYMTNWLTDTGVSFCLIILHRTNRALHIFMWSLTFGNIYNKHETPLSPIQKLYPSFHEHDNFYLKDIACLPQCQLSSHWKFWLNWPVPNYNKRQENVNHYIILRMSYSRHEICCMCSTVLVFYDHINAGMSLGG